MFELQYFILGLIQGVTEFLPISSSAHLILISEFTSWDDQGLFNDIAVHAGTLGAVIIYLLNDIKKIVTDSFQFRKTKYYALKIIVATIPAILVGFIVYEYFITYFRSIIVIAWSSIIFGIILFLADQKKKFKKKLERYIFLRSSHNWFMAVNGIYSWRK